MQTSNIDLADSELKFNVNKKRAYPFVDIIRFLSIVGIVWGHTDALPGDIELFLKQTTHSEYYFAYKQLFKFSVICFYLVSGFLIPSNLTEGEKYPYYLRRVRKTIIPYAIAFLFLIVCFYTNQFGFDLMHLEFLWIIKCAFTIITRTAFWFLLNYYFSLFIIIRFSKYLGSIFFGLSLLLVTLVYTFLSVYNVTDQGDHTTALGGFIFYLWLGYYIKRIKLHETFRKIHYRNALILAIVCYLTATAESYLMFNAGMPHFFNILRLSNQIYSIVIFIFLIRVEQYIRIPSYFNPRKESYGIYLFHIPFVAFLYPLFGTALQKYLDIKLYGTEIASMLGFTFLKFLICFLLTVFFVRFLFKLKILL